MHKITFHFDQFFISKLYSCKPIYLNIIYKILKRIKSVPAYNIEYLSLGLPNLVFCISRLQKSFSNNNVYPLKRTNLHKLKIFLLATLQKQASKRAPSGKTLSQVLEGFTIHAQWKIRRVVTPSVSFDTSHWSYKGSFSSPIELYFFTGEVFLYKAQIRGNFSSSIPKRTFRGFFISASPSNLPRRNTDHHLRKLCVARSYVYFVCRTTPSEGFPPFTKMDLR